MGSPRVLLTDRLDAVLGAKAAKSLDEVFGIQTVDDLLRHYPRKYSQGMTVRGEDDEPPEEGEHITFVGEIEKVDVRWTNRQPRREYVVITLSNRRPKVTATFFNAKYLKKQLVEGTRLMLSGEVGYYKGTMQLTHPAYLILNSPSGRLGGTKSLKTIAASAGGHGDELDMSVFERDYFPIYPASAKLQSWDIYACVRQVLNVLDPIPESLPEAVVQHWDLVSEDAALRGIHLAEKEADRERARQRLTFDEAVGLQWALVQRRSGDLADSGPPAPRRDDGLAAALGERLPFELTTGQHEVLEVIAAELAATKPMHRLLQGEVGSGKTIVSVLAMLQMVDAGYQCALLAPTEVLAAQHARSVCDVLGPLAMAGQLGGAEHATRVALLTGSMSPAQKRQVRDEVASGAAGIVIGTHALLQDAVEFHRLGMVVIDEQHRFGVEQRDRLRAKAPEGMTPHLLVMTATPIPRTVALTVYGDLETSTLRELPRGRQPITTTTIFVTEKPQWLSRAWQRIREEVAEGRQAYVVASRIDENDKPDAAATAESAGGNLPPPVPVVTVYEQLRTGPLSGLRLGLMHGRLSAEEKDAAMAAFRAGEIDVLICTTVIEVGIDVPNATVMFIHDAGRFGLAQLHQLRGRIGRGAHTSYCVLFIDDKDEENKMRLAIMEETSDGFQIAEEDLKRRGPGDVLGHAQSGEAPLLFGELLADTRLVRLARQLADKTLEDDPTLSRPALAAFRDAIATPEKAQAMMQ